MKNRNLEHSDNWATLLRMVEQATAIMLRVFAIVPNGQM